MRRTPNAEQAWSLALSIYLMIVIAIPLTAFGQGTVFSTNPVWWSEEIGNTEALAFGDVDGDGDLDLICGDFYDGLRLYKNDGNMLESTPSWSATRYTRTWALALGDVDDDGDLDLVCGNHGRNSLYLNDGGSFGENPDWRSREDYYTFGIALGDVDGDGDLDLVCGNGVYELPQPLTL